MQSNLSDPVGHDWSQDKNGIDIVWNECSPASNEVLYLPSCGCSKKCKVRTCSCSDNDLQCTDSCHTRECKNILEDFLRDLDVLNQVEDD